MVVMWNESGVAPLLPCEALLPRRTLWRML